MECSSDLELFHGPPCRRLVARCWPSSPTALAGWEWDVALLQEVPPWWPPELAGAEGWGSDGADLANSLLPLRRAIADARQTSSRATAGLQRDLLRRHGIEDHRVEVLRRWPERRTPMPSA